MFYEYGNTMYLNDGAELLAVGLFIILFSIGLLLMIANYIINGWSLTQVARNKNLPTWMPWIPYVNSYLLVKSARGNIWFLITLIYVPFTILNTSFYSDFLGAIISVLFWTHIVYKLVMWYKVGKDYKASKLLFWLGVFILPCKFAYVIQVGRRARASSTEGTVQQVVLDKYWDKNKSKKSSKRRPNSNYRANSNYRGNNDTMMPIFYDNDRYDSFDNNDDCGSDSYDSGDCDCSSSD